MKTIKIRIYHGSIRKYRARKQPKEIGGLFGGHVVIQIGQTVYGFIYKDDKRIHIFPRKHNKNCVFQEIPVKEWEEIVSTKKETLVTIPVEASDINYLLDYYKKNIKSASVDYSFIGERCSSNCYRLLKHIGKIKGGHYIFNAFYPGQFKRKLIIEARKRGYKVEVRQGAKDRMWQ